MNTKPISSPSDPPTPSSSLVLVSFPSLLSWIGIVQENLNNSKLYVKGTDVLNPSVNAMNKVSWGYTNEHCDYARRGRQAALQRGLRS